METPKSAGVMKGLGGAKGLWLELVDGIAARYDHEPVVVREGKDKSWTIRYRRGGKTLVTLYPREGEFTVLVVLGKEEVEKAARATLNETVKGVFAGARQYHDGRWLWLKPKTKGDVDSIFKLLAVKRRPKE